MSHSSALFNRVPIDLPNKSGFNLDHENLFSATCGTLVPALCHPLLPNDTISLGVNFQVQLPPMVTDFYGKVDAVYETFFVPFRLLWGGWKDFITHPSSNPIYPQGTPYQRKPTRVPTLVMNGYLDYEAGSLADYLGLMLDGADELPSSLYLNVLPFISYHMIWDHWYRDSRIQSPAFYPPASGITAGATPAVLPHVSVISASNLAAPSFAGSSTLADGVRLDALRQRNWSKGYFTSASPYPQGGQPSEVSFDVVDNTGAFTIASLRSANSLQRWKERNNFSYEYGDQIYLQFGIYPKSETMDKPIYLGRVVQPVYSRSVMQTAPGDGTLNDVVGAKKASTQVVGEGRLVDNFTASEHGFLFTMFSLRPHGYYSSGANRFFFELQSEDFPFPLLAGMGDQAIYTSELNGFSIDGRGDIFGYTDLYAHYKYIEDQVHGKLRDGEDLDSFALQRSFADEVELSSAFLEIPINAMDQVQAVTTSAQGFSCWVDTFFKFSKISTLPAYSLPTLGDLKNTHKGSASRGGSRL